MYFNPLSRNAKQEVIYVKLVLMLLISNANSTV